MGAPHLPRSSLRPLLMVAETRLKVRSQPRRRQTHEIPAHRFQHCYFQTTPTAWAVNGRSHFGAQCSGKAFGQPCPRQGVVTPGLQVPAGAVILTPEQQLQGEQPGANQSSRGLCPTGNFGRGRKQLKPKIQSSSIDQ